MRKVFIAAAAMLAVGLIVTMIPTPALALTGPHNGITTSNDCSVCHTPHNPTLTGVGAPLWGHAVTGATFTMYPAAALDMTIAGSPQLGSLLCLSCHDGVTDIKPGGSPMSGGHVIGVDLTDDHPISVTYDPSATPDATEWATLAVVQAGVLPLDGTSNDMVNCTSCHQAHKENLVTDGDYLRLNQDTLCGTCHKK